LWSSGFEVVRKKERKRKKIGRTFSTFFEEKERKEKEKEKGMEPRESGPPLEAAFPPLAPSLFASPGSGKGSRLQALLSSLDPCGRSGAESGASVASSGGGIGRRVCSAAMMTVAGADEGSRSLLFLSLVAALVGLLAYLSLLAVARARR
jgi:hypothetical protein